MHGLPILDLQVHGSSRLSAQNSVQPVPFVWSKNFCHVAHSAAGSEAEVPVHWAEAVAATPAKMASCARARVQECGVVAGLLGAG